MKGKDIIKKGSLFFIKCLNDSIDQHYEDEMAYALARQREEDVCCAIAAFLDLKTSETDIMRLLSAYYGIDSIEQVMELINTVKVHNRVKEFRDYLTNLGMSRVQVIYYLKDHSVETQLRNESKLMNISIDKLKSYFDKH